MKYRNMEQPALVKTPTLAEMAEYQAGYYYMTMGTGDLEID